MGELLLEKRIPKDDSYDVFVAGGGPAGCAAAAQAARGGAKVLLIEATGSLGGMGTMGMVPAWCPMTDGQRVIYAGIAEEVYNRACELYPHEIHGKDWTPIEPEGLKRTYDELVEGAGVDVLFCTTLAGVETADGHVEAVIVSNKSGLSAYSAKTYIDATGDGDLAAWAGAEYKFGDDETHETQLATHCFSVANVEENAYLDGPSLHFDHNPNSPIKQWAEGNEYPHIVDKHFCQNLTTRGVVGFNANHIYDVDATNPASVSAAFFEGRKIAWSIADALRKYVPAFRASYIGETAPLMGIRESRRIVGDYELNAEDYYARRSFPDEISRCCYYIDIHTKKGSKGEIPRAESERREARYQAGESYGVPYRCLTPKGLDNMLVAGRCISCDRSILASVRIMPACLTTGQAAGAAAVLANGGDVHKVDADALRAVLRRAGAYFK